MDHCVATYTAWCAKRLTTIWSVGIEEVGGRGRVATVEVNPASREVVAPAGLFGLPLGKGLVDAKYAPFVVAHRASCDLLDDLEPVNTSYGTSVQGRPHGQSLPILLGAVTYLGR